MTHTQAPCLPTGGSPAGAALRWVEECLGKGAEVRTVRPLPGGGAHTNHALLVESGSGSTHELVLRRWTASQEPGPGHLRHSATAAFSPEREIAALALLAGCEIPTPAL
ncbi:hypothetical protein E1289_34950, partial [Actinomadura sp. 6K520]